MNQDNSVIRRLQSCVERFPPTHVKEELAELIELYERGPLSYKEYEQIDLASDLRCLLCLNTIMSCITCAHKHLGKHTSYLLLRLCIDKYQKGHIDFSGHQLAHLYKNLIPEIKSLQDIDSLKGIPWILWLILPIYYKD